MSDLYEIQSDKEKFFGLVISMVNQAEDKDNSITSEDKDIVIGTPTLAQTIEEINVLVKFVENSYIKIESR